MILGSGSGYLCKMFSHHSLDIADISQTLGARRRFLAELAAYLGG